MSKGSRSPLARMKREIGLLGVELREGLKLRGQLALLELQADFRAAKRLAVVVAIAVVMALTALPLLAVCLAQLLDGWWAVSGTGWLAVFGSALLLGGILGASLAYRHFRRNLIGLEETLEELREDLLWLQEWTGRGDEKEPESAA